MILGMLEIGKMNPERRNAGSKVEIIENIKASCWDFVIVDIKSPIPKPVIKNIPEIMKRKNIFPLKGTLNNKNPIRIIMEIWSMPRKK